MRKTKKVTVNTQREHHMGDTMTQIRNNVRLSQEDVAQRLGKSQQTVSHLEQSEQFADEVLEEVVKALGVTVEYFKNYKPPYSGFTVHHIQDNGQANNYGYIQHFNPMTEMLKAHEENKQLFREKEELFKSMLAGKDTEIAELRAELLMLKAQLAEQDKQIKILQELLGNNGKK